jgi:hypothetical protein
MGESFSLPRNDLDRGLEDYQVLGTWASSGTGLRLVAVSFLRKAGDGGADGLDPNGRARRTKDLGVGESRLRERYFASPGQSSDQNGQDEPALLH